jgi:hypothetical protein
MTYVSRGGRHFHIEHGEAVWWVWEVDHRGAIAGEPATALVAMAGSHGEARLAARLHVGGAARSTIERAMSQHRRRRLFLLLRKR